MYGRFVICFTPAAWSSISSCPNFMYVRLRYFLPLFVVPRLSCLMTKYPSCAVLLPMVKRFRTPPEGPP